MTLILQKLYKINVSKPSLTENYQNETLVLNQKVDDSVTS